MTEQAKTAVEAFNDCINHQDLEGLAQLTTDEHKFVDSAAGTVSGKDACLKAWASFFSAFPDYRNQFDRLVSDGNKVVIAGSSTCSDSRLAGPALWQATLLGDQLAEWRVYEDTHANRLALAIAK